MEDAADDWLLHGPSLGRRCDPEAHKVDLTRRTISVPKPGKRGKSVTIPMHDKLFEYLQRVTKKNEQDDYVMPTLASADSGGKLGLSEAFIRIATKAGVDLRQIIRANRKTFRKRTFHSVRHGFVSGLANEGVSPEHRRAITGHKTEILAALNGKAFGLLNVTSGDVEDEMALSNASDKEHGYRAVHIAGLGNLVSADFGVFVEPISGGARVWNLRTKESSDLKTGEMPFRSLNLSPDGFSLVASTQQNLLTWWSLRDPSSPPVSIAADSDARWFDSDTFAPILRQIYPIDQLLKHLPP